MNNELRAAMQMAAEILLSVRSAHTQQSQQYVNAEELKLACEEYHLASQR